MITPWGFDLHFPVDYWCWEAFHVPVGHLYVLFGNIYIQVLCLFFNIVQFLVLSGILIYFEYYPFTEHIVCKYLFLFSTLHFFLLIVPHSMQKLLRLRYLFVYFYFAYFYFILLIFLHLFIAIKNLFMFVFVSLAWRDR